jgi:flavin-dependent dehydrogenase
LAREAARRVSAFRAVDVAVVGGGPAGLAAAVEAARRGFSVEVFERRPGVPDKACGEGLMPRGAAALERLGATAHLDLAQCARFVGIRYVQESGGALEARFSGREGLGVRRTALAQALACAAEASGARLHRGAAAREIRVEEDGVTVEVGGERILALALVAADGLHSALRRQLGLDLHRWGPRRFGVRRHYRGVDPGEFVEVHWSKDSECYLTPVGPDRLAVAFLFAAERARPSSFGDLLEQFPRVVQRLRGGVPDSAMLGAGPMDPRARRVALGRVALVGDAAGAVDAITGEGLTLAFECAAQLGAALPEVCVAGGEWGFARYERAHARLLRGRSAEARALVFLAARPDLRRRVFAAMERVPRAFELAVRALAG